MSYQWNDVGPKAIDEVTHVLTVDGERVAAVWWLGGHVERPDAWHITFRPSDKAKGGSLGFETAEAAKKHAEEVLGLKPEPVVDEVVMYFVARKDLKMSPGKLAAQVGHGVQYILQVINLPENSRWYTEWRHGDHTKIVLAANSEEELDALATQLGVRARVVVDRGRTEVQPNTKTLVAIAPMPKSVAKPFVGHFRIY